MQYNVTEILSRIDLNKDYIASKVAFGTQKPLGGVTMKQILVGLLQDRIVSRLSYNLEMMTGLMTQQSINSREQLALLLDVHQEGLIDDIALTQILLYAGSEKRAKRIIDRHLFLLDEKKGLDSDQDKLNRINYLSLNFALYRNIGSMGDNIDYSAMEISGLIDSLESMKQNLKGTTGEMYCCGALTPMYATMGDGEKAFENLEQYLDSFLQQDLVSNNDWYVLVDALKRYQRLLVRFAALDLDQDGSKLALLLDMIEKSLLLLAPLYATDRETMLHFSQQIDSVREDKNNAVREQLYEKAADLRDQEHRLTIEGKRNKDGLFAYQYHGVLLLLKGQSMMIQAERHGDLGGNRKLFADIGNLLINGYVDLHDRAFVSTFVKLCNDIDPDNATNFLRYYDLYKKNDKRMTFNELVALCDRICCREQHLGIDSGE